MVITKFSATILIVLLVVGMSHAQGTFGGRSFGGGVSSGGSSGGFGGASAFGGASPGNAISQSQQGAGQVTGNERFVRGSRQPGQFVGADSGDTQNFFSQMQSGFSLNNRPGANVGRNNRRSSNRNSQQSRTPIIRRRLHVAFEYDRLDSDQLQRRLETRLSRFAVVALPGSPGIEIIAEGATVVMRGKVESEQAKQLAERLVKLEPGVWEIRNELVVGGSQSPDDVRMEVLPTPKPSPTDS